MESSSQPLRLDARFRRQEYQYGRGGSALSKPFIVISDDTSLVALNKALDAPDSNAADSRRSFDPLKLHFFAWTASRLTSL